MPTLVPCHACDRHVKAESVCPFCGNNIVAATARPATAALGARRAAMLAVSAALASTAFVACGDDSPTGGSSTGGQAQGGDAAGGSPAEGGGGEVAIGGAGGQVTNGGGGSGGDGTGGNIAPPYGAPPV